MTMSVVVAKQAARLMSNWGKNIREIARSSWLLLYASSLRRAGCTVYTRQMMTRQQEERREDNSQACHRHLALIKEGTALWDHCNPVFSELFQSCHLTLGPEAYEHCEAKDRLNIQGLWEFTGMIHANKMWIPHIGKPTLLCLHSNSYCLRRQTPEWDLSDMDKYQFEADFF